MVDSVEPTTIGIDEDIAQEFECLGVVFRGRPGVDRRGLLYVSTCLWMRQLRRLE